MAAPFLACNERGSAIDPVVASECTTIVALASGRPPAAIALLRISGPAAFQAVRNLSGVLPPPRFLRLRALIHPANGALLDRCLTAIYPAPASATGEDVVELNLHGGTAVVEAVLSCLLLQPGVRLAQPGEFTRRAFDNGKLDLTQAEALADLIDASTEAQRAQAMLGAEGALSRLASDWGRRLIDILAAMEADLDFSDQDETANVALSQTPMLDEIYAEMTSELARASFSERIRDGLTIVLVGPPNVGKSSLLNALARRQVSIVAPTPGTTRDLVEVALNLAGVAVTLVDTAGLRESLDPIELEGIRRARARADTADLILHLNDAATHDTIGQHVRTKIDLTGHAPGIYDGSIFVSSVTGAGLADMENWLVEWAHTSVSRGEPGLIVNMRQRQAIEKAAAEVDTAVKEFDGVLRAEALRSAIGELTQLHGGRVTDDVLDRIFAKFCIGK